MQNIPGLWLGCLRQYFSMCLLLSSPERLPYSAHCLILTITAYFLVGLFQVTEAFSAFEIFLLTGLEIAMLAAITWIALRLKNLMPRFQQTLSALIGINLIMSSISILASRFAEGSEDGRLTTILLVLIVVWTLAAISLVFKRAFDISTHISAIIAFNYFVLFQIIVYLAY